MIEKERQSELIRKFVVSQEMPDDEIANLSLDELTYIYFNTAEQKTEQLPDLAASDKSDAFLDLPRVS